MNDGFIDLYRLKWKIDSTKPVKKNKCGGALDKDPVRSK